MRSEGTGASRSHGLSKLNQAKILVRAEPHTEEKIAQNRKWKKERESPAQSGVTELGDLRKGAPVFLNTTPETRRENSTAIKSYSESYFLLKF